MSHCHGFEAFQGNKCWSIGVPDSWKGKWQAFPRTSVIRVIFGVFSKGHVTLSYVPCLGERLCYLCMIDWDRNTWSDLSEVIGFNQCSSVSHVPYLDHDICQILEPLARAAAEVFFFLCFCRLFGECWRSTKRYQQKVYAKAYQEWRTCWIYTLYVYCYYDYDYYINCIWI